MQIPLSARLEGHPLAFVQENEKKPSTFAVGGGRRLLPRLLCSFFPAVTTFVSLYGLIIDASTIDQHLSLAASILPQWRGSTLLCMSRFDAPDGEQVIAA